MKRLLRKFFMWLFKQEFEELQNNLDYIKEVVGDKHASCSLDYHMQSPSWAVINLHGRGRTYLKFIKLTNNDCKHILEYLKQFEEINIDATPNVTKFMHCELKM